MLLCLVHHVRYATFNIKPSIASNLMIIAHALWPVMLELGLKWVLYGKNLRDQNPWRLDITVKLHLSTLNRTLQTITTGPWVHLEFYGKNPTVDVMIRFNCD